MLYSFLDDIVNGLTGDPETAYICAKSARTRDLVNYMLSRSQQIFTWSGLPDTIPERNLELLLQSCGNICITDVSEVPAGGKGDPGLYAFWGGLGNEPNAYYEPTKFIVSNPYLNFYRELEIGSECVWARNDALGSGLMPMFLKYATMQNENEISLNIAAINYRIDTLLSADDDRTADSAKQFLDDILIGKLGVISSSEFFEGLKAIPNNGSGKSIKDLIEYEQYLKASWYNEIGLNSNYNMKRERIVAAEAQLTDDALIPLVENMLYCRQQAIEQIKELYGDKYDLDDLAVALNPVWDLDGMYAGMIPEKSDVVQEGESNVILDRDADELDDPGDSDDISVSEDIEETTETMDETPEEPEAPEGSEAAEVSAELEEVVEDLEGIVEELTEENENEET